MLRRSRVAIALLLVVGSTATLPAAPDSAPARGKFVVASRDLADPNFARTVVLLLDYGPGGAMGVVVNRLSETTLAQAVPGIQGRVPASEPLYDGGPVERDELLLLARSEHALEGAREVVAGVWVGNSQKLLDELAKSAGARFRLYAGYAGWGPGQLEGEIEAGGWHIVAATGDTIFDARPGDLWQRLVPPDPLQMALDERGAVAAEVRSR